VISLTDVKAVSDFQCTLSGDRRKKECLTPFYFAIPRSAVSPHDPEYAAEVVSSEPSRSPQALPPSLRIRTQPKSSPMEPDYGTYGSCDVEYTVTAKALLRGTTVAETSREVLLTPSAESSPPLDITDFPGEYRLSASSMLMNPLRLKKYGQLFVTSSEIEPMTVAVQNGETSTGSGSVVLDLIFRPNDHKDTTVPDFMDCEVATQLEAMTYYSVARQDHALTVKTAEESRYVGHERWTAKEQTRKLRLPRWEKEPGIAGSSNPAVWKNSTAVTFTHQSSVVVLPTFQSSLVSRHYTLLVHVKLRSDKRHVLHTSLELRIPVQLVYPSPTRRGGQDVRHSPPELIYDLGLPGYEEYSPPRRDIEPPPYISVSG